MLNKLASAPEVIEKVIVSPSGSVAVTKNAPVWFSKTEYIDVELVIVGGLLP